jgi:hypothetical protein
MSNVFVFRPGAVSTPELPLPANVSNNWPDLMTKLSDPSIGGRKVIEFDDSIQKCVIPAAGSPHEMKDVSWAGFGPRSGSPRSVVEISDGATFTNLRMIGGQIAIISKATTVSPISDFPEGPVTQVQIGMRDDCGATHFVNQGAAPLFDVKSSRVFFFLQNCLFGVTALGLVSTSPLIHVNGSGNQLNLNLLGQTNVGENVVRAEGGAVVLMAAFSLAAQVGAIQTQISNPPNAPQGGGVLRISPPGRIQREIIPPPPQSPAVGPLAPDQLGLLNALIRCDGRVLNVQTLPKILGGFNIFPGNVAMYTGGQELIIAEVAGGSQLSVSPFLGDTIDGREGLVRIGRHGSRTFVSDGNRNWITTSLVPGRRRLEQPEHPEFEDFT